MEPTLPFQLVVTDADGTVLDSSGRAAPGSIEAIQEAQARGVHVCLATGRGFLIAKPLVDLLCLRDPVILSGGALILSPHGEVIDQQPLPQACAEEIARLARETGLGMSFHEPDGVYAEADDFTWERLARRNWFPDETELVLPFKRVRDVLAVRPSAPPLRIDLFGRDELISATENGLAATFPELLVMRVFHHLEVTCRGVDKGSAVKRLAAYLGVPLSATFVIGDEVNDVPMFAVAGMGVAMGNGMKELQAMAGAVAPGNDAGGFAWALREFVLAD